MEKRLISLLRRKGILDKNNSPTPVFLKKINENAIFYDLSLKDAAFYTIVQFAGRIKLEDVVHTMRLLATQA